MKNQEMLFAMYDIVSALPKESAETVNYILSKSIKWDTNMYETKIAYLIRRLKSDIIEDEQMKTGKTDRAKACKNILKNAKKKTTLEAFHYPIETSDGKQVFSDNFSLVEYAGNDKIPFEETPDAIKEIQKTYNIERLFPKDEGKVLSLPTLPELKAYIKIEKSKFTKKDIKDGKSVVYILDGDIHVNAEYLLNIMEALPNAKAEIHAEGKVITFTSESGSKGLLMTIAKN